MILPRFPHAKDDLACFASDLGADDDHYVNGISYHEMTPEVARSYDVALLFTHYSIPGLYPRNMLNRPPHSQLIDSHCCIERWVKEFPEFSEPGPE